MRTPVEALEEARLVRDVEADTGVRDVHDCVAFLHIERRDDRAARWRVAGRVVQEDPEQFSQPVPVTVDSGWLDRCDAHMPVRGCLSLESDGLNQQSIKFDRLEPEARTGFRSSQGQQITDEPAHPLSLLA